MKIPVASALLAIVLLSPMAANAASCESLASLVLPDATITMAQSVAAGQFTLPGGGGTAQQNAAFKELPAFCRILSTL